MTDPLASKPAVTAHDPESAAREITDAYHRIKAEIHKVIVGQDEVVDELLVAIFCGGHALVVGVPGLAKTLLISTIAKTLSLGFSRDPVHARPHAVGHDGHGGHRGGQVDRSTRAAIRQGARSSRTSSSPTRSTARRPRRRPRCWRRCRSGRSPPAACATRCPQPFFVLATQNPIEQEGTYPLPEAQLDRFMFNVHDSTTRPRIRNWRSFSRRPRSRRPSSRPMLSGEDVLRIQSLVRQVPVADHVVRYALADRSGDAHSRRERRSRRWSRTT